MQIDSTAPLSVRIDNIATDLNNKLDRDGINCTSAAWLLPADKAHHIEFSADSNTVISPINGYLYFSKKTVSPNQYLSLRNETLEITDERQCSYANASLTAMIPVRKNDRVTINYNAEGILEALKWIPAKCEV